MSGVYRGKSCRVDSVRVGDPVEPGRVVLAMAGQGRRVVYEVMHVADARQLAERLDLAIQSATIENELAQAGRPGQLGVFAQWLRRLPVLLGLRPVGVEQLGGKGGEP